MRLLLAALLLPLLAGCGDERPEVGGGPMHDAWRTELWKDVSVQVPASWGYGGTDCFPEASWGSDGERRDGGTAYVGRPLPLSDVCVARAADAPLVSSLWFDAGVPVGRESLGDGWVRETVAVNGSRITVTTDDAGLRSEILSTATGGETCLSEIEPASADPFVRTEPGDPRDAARLTVCVYRYVDGAPGSGEPVPLVYAAALGPTAVEGYLDSVEGAEPEVERCPAADVVEGEWVALELGENDGTVVRRDVVHLACPGIDLEATGATGSRTVALTDERTAPWAQDGVNAVLGYLVGPQG